MLDHHIQRTIVYQLAFAPSMRFGELKPDDVDNKLFTYHLKKVMLAGYVAKNDDGQYELTAEGRRMGKGVLKKESHLLDRAYSTLFLAIRRKSDGAWLLYTRHTHPLFGLTGFMHAQPSATETAAETAAKICRQNTGLTGTFRVHGHGYFRVYHEEQLESFTHFTLLICDDTMGELAQNSELAEYHWDEQPDFTAAQMLPTMRALSTMYTGPVGSFTEQTFTI